MAPLDDAADGPAHALERVIVVPRNGYINRLQAWASSAILAAQLDVPLSVLWEKEAVAGADAEEIFAPSLITRSFISRSEVDALCGGSHESLSRYLWLDRSRGLIVLAGHDAGEQAFMESLPGLLADESAPQTLLIIAGGKFTMFPDDDFVLQRKIFYSQLAWSDRVLESTRGALAGRDSFVGVHIRGTDRALEAPTRRDLRSGLAQLRETSSSEDLFIAADSEEGRAYWSREAARMGFRPWTRSHVSFDRSTNAAAVDALTDWRVLAQAESIVYTAASSFGEEAAVAGGHFSRCIGLSSSHAIQRTRKNIALVKAVVTYPYRRFHERH